MKTVIAVLGFVALIFLNHVEGRSMGAPDSACTNVSPDPTAHLGPAQSGASPFTLTVDGSPSVYIPDQEYNCKMSLCVWIHYIINIHICSHTWVIRS